MLYYLFTFVVVVFCHFNLLTIFGGIGDGLKVMIKKYNRQTNPHPINMSKFSPIRQAALLFLVPFPLVIIIVAGIANVVATNLHASVVVVYLFHLFASYINRCHCIWLFSKLKIHSNAKTALFTISFMFSKRMPSDKILFVHV